MSARLLILGILMKEPMHGYELKRVTERSQTAQWARVLPGSIYHALKTMTSEKLLRVAETQSQGHRQRAIYAITPAGREEFHKLLRAAFQDTPDSLPSTLYLALSFVEHLPPAELDALLQGMLARLRQARRAWDQGEMGKASVMPLSPWLVALFQNGRDHLDADIRLLELLGQQARALPTGGSRGRRGGR